MKPRYELGASIVETGALEHPQFLSAAEAAVSSGTGEATSLVEAQPLELAEVRDTVAAAYVDETVAGLVSSEVAASAPLLPEDISVRDIVEAKNEKPKFTSRPATESDIDSLVDIDMKAFAKVYAGYDQSPEDLRADLTEKFRGRYERLGGRWIRIAEKDGEPVGFTVACPTSKAPEDFESWEKTTDNGTLETTYDLNGDYIYVTSLSMLDGAGETPRNMLFASMLSEAIKGGYKSAYFESRLPGLRTWMKRESIQRGTTIDELTEDDKAEMADTYYNLKVTKKGKELPYDYLMRIYAQAGCKFVKLVPDAYADDPSMNYGAVGVFDVPVPKAVLNNRIARNIVGKGVDLLARSEWAVKKLF